MNKTIRALAFTLTFGLGGCALFGGAPKASNEITPEQEAKLREIGGEQLVADARYVFEELGEGEEGDGIYQVRQCLRSYLLARKQEREGEVSPQGQYQSCVKMCEAADKRTDRHAEVTARYIATCGAERDKLAGAKHLERARDRLDDFAKAEGDVNRYYRASEVRGALRQAEEALGAEHQELASVRGEFEAAYEPHREAIERVQAFFAREDVEQLRRRIDDLQAEVEGLEKDAQWSEHAKSLLVQRERELAEAEQALSTMMQEAKL